MDETKWDLRIFLKHLYIYDSDDPNSVSVLGGQQNQRDLSRSQQGLQLTKMLIWNEIFGIIETKACKWRRQEGSNKEQGLI